MDPSGKERLLSERGLHKKSIVSLFVNKIKPAAQNTADKVRHFLEKQGVQVVDFDPNASNVDFYCTIGGDGTILQLLHQARYLDAPIIGINLGGLGFLAEISPEALETSLEALVRGSYTLKRRLMLQAQTETGALFSAANDVVLHRVKNPHLVDIAVHVGGRYINTFAGDGLIISTPTGSTAYSLAAGGPILTPELNAFVLTPIAAHTISNRPIVLSTDEEITLEYLNTYDALEVTFDGLVTTTLAPTQVLTVRPSLKTFCLASLSGSDFFSTLRGKLGWTGRLRLNEE